MAMKVEADVGSVQDLCHALSAKVLRLEAEVGELRKKDRRGRRGRQGGRPCLVKRNVNLICWRGPMPFARDWQILGSP
jgi:hypothetical protein